MLVEIQQAIQSIIMLRMYLSNASKYAHDKLFRCASLEAARI